MILNFEILENIFWVIEKVLYMICQHAGLDTLLLSTFSNIT